MDLRNHLLLYRVNFAVLLYFTCCHSVASDPIKKNMLDAITTCDSLKFLRNSSYVSNCNKLSYPLTELTEYEDNDLNFMCKTLNHITNKICEFRVGDTSQIKVPETAEKFDEEVKKFEPTSEDRTDFVAGWCKNSTSFFNASMKNDTNGAYLKYANDILLDKTECIDTCQIRHGVNKFCMVFFWFNKLYNTLQPSKNFNNSKESVVVSQRESLFKSIANDNSGKQGIMADNNNEHTSIANQKPPKEQPQSKVTETAVDIPNNSKVESTGLGNEQEMKKNADQPEKYEKEQQKPDFKLSTSTDDKSNVADNKIENPKAEFQEGNDDSMDEERKKIIEEGVEAENDRDIMETNNRNSFSDSGGDLHSFPESPVIKEEDESHFFMYFSIFSFACVMLYVGFHNKQKILAIVVEGRQSRRGRSSRRRPNTANYRKLDSNLEEAVTSQCNSNVTHHNEKRRCLELLGINSSTITDDLCLEKTIELQ